MGVPYAEVIGDPIAHSKSPLIHRFWLDKLGMEADYRACLVRPHELAAYFDARQRDERWRGCNITMPHKIAALRHVSMHRDPSFPIEGVNLAVRTADARIDGINADTPGFLQPLLQRFGFAREGARGPAIVVGSGGVLFSVMWGLAALGFAPLFVIVRDAEKARRIAEDYGGVHARVLGFDDALPPANMLVNATPLGMRGFPAFALSLGTLSSDAVVYDLVYDPLETELIRQARQRGLNVVDGLSMLIPQAAISFRALFGAEAPRSDDRELRKLLSA